MEAERTTGISPTVVEGFSTPQDAATAIEALLEAGFATSQIGIVTNDDIAARIIADEVDARIALRSVDELGASADERLVYADLIDDGAILVVVAAGERKDEARDVMFGTLADDVLITEINLADHDSTGNPILDASIGTTAGLTPAIDTLIGEEPGEGYERLDDEDDDDENEDVDEDDRA
ncbi:MAG TPA: hypothetical protein PKA95_01935 [Thermomicrobiales bacterium]|nr:hypothetical protein [Thermomicrobiales bacterium]